MIKSSTLPASAQLVCWDRNATVPPAASIATFRFVRVFHGKYGKSGVETLTVSSSRPALRRRIALIGWMLLQTRNIFRWSEIANRSEKLISGCTMCWSLRETTS